MATSLRPEVELVMMASKFRLHLSEYFKIGEIVQSIFIKPITTTLFYNSFHRVI